ncbi:hypothetical protein [uncultured Algimonas sp.]|uniref:hypothetical protein n=1 Tax=uncultured Algimonas sp. TaxID=1547920 RepID=UPI002625E715|nr:hypothetical protein [uncultured Algimonas sp.]
MKDFLEAWEALPEGNFFGHYKGTRYGITRTERDSGRQAWLWAEELGGPHRVSANLYRLASGTLLKPCEMPEAVVIDFVLNVRPIAHEPR